MKMGKLDIDKMVKIETSMELEIVVQRKEVNHSKIIPKCLTQQPKKFNEMMSFTGKWMLLEGIRLSTINQIQKVKGHMFSFTCGI